MSATCEVVARAGDLFVFPTCELQAGVRMVCAPAQRMALDSDPLLAGAAVIAALERFQSNVPFPDDFTAAANRALDGTGVKSWRTFAKGARRLDVSANAASIIVTPTAADGKGAYANLPDRALTVPIEPRSIGEAVRDALLACEARSRIE
jgi:hypothetical protein